MRGDPFALVHLALVARSRFATRRDAAPLLLLIHHVREPELAKEGPMSATTLIIILAVFILLGGGWGYSRRGR